MAINYLDLYRDKVYTIGQDTEDTDITTKLDTYAQIQSRNFATPWGGFDDVPEKEKYVVVLVTAREFWWKKVAEFTAKHDQNYGGQIGQSSDTMFSRALTMVEKLTQEIAEAAPDIEGSGDIIVGDIRVRSKMTGHLVPDPTDVRGNWLSE
jgi:hypothetical protein